MDTDLEQTYKDALIHYRRAEEVAIPHERPSRQPEEWHRHRSMFARILGGKRSEKTGLYFLKLGDLLKFEKWVKDQSAKVD